MMNTFVILTLPPHVKNMSIYWSILKTFYNAKKVPIFPPLLINDKLISDFEVKASYFNNFFAS